ncbi:MAG: Fe-Mn family superoxide dismutase [Nanoarchaeota archaeon]
MTYTAQNFEPLLGLKGFSDQLLQNHFKLYQGYVANTNKLLDTLAAMEKDDKTTAPEYAELKRRFGWEFNGMRLHELYFQNMTKKKTALSESSALHKLMTQAFGSSQKCLEAFVDTGKMRGIGWVMMAYDPASKRLLNLWINEHDSGHLAGAVPLLVMDVFEHAFMLDYGLNRAEYIKAFTDAIDWSAVQKRFENA